MSKERTIRIIKFQFIEDLMNPCNIGRCMNVNLRCLMY